MNNYSEYNFKLGFKNVSDKTFVPLCQGVIASLKDNDNFPDVGALLSELETAFDEYNAAIPPRQDRSPARTAIRDAKREVVKILMRTVGFYCLMVARNDYEKLKTSGFTVAKPTHSSTPVEMPMPIILSTHSNGTPEQLIVKCQASKAVKLYDVRTSTDENNWMVTTNDKSVVKINNLPTEVVLYVQLRYRHGDHATPWSAVTQTRIFNSAIALPLAN